ncbi:MAG: RT0821/Lpp0805 family surface protein [Salaquimonas sp.]
MSLVINNKLAASFADDAINNNTVPRKLFNTVGAVICAISLSACAVGGTMSKIDKNPEIITGSITKPVEADGIDATDAETIKLTVVDAANAPADSNLLAWSNPETGNSGTITAIDKYIGTHGQSCKKFRTTVDSFMGIALYNGETCELKKGFWVLSWFIRDSAS